MFTGLIQQTGIVFALTGENTRRLTVNTILAASLRLGDSIAVNGVCLTAIDLCGDEFSADLLEETLDRTTFTAIAPGTVVNLELPTPAGAPLGGHIVQGHVDGIGTVLQIERESKSGETWRFGIRVPEGLRRYIVEKGSISVDGISLTVADINGDTVEMSIIPHTYSSTNIHTLRLGDKVNLETDPLAKYAENLRTSANAESRITLANLIARGY